MEQRVWRYRERIEKLISPICERAERILETGELEGAETLVVALFCYAWPRFLFFLVFLRFEWSESPSEDTPIPSQQ